MVWSIFVFSMCAYCMRHVRPWDHETCNLTAFHRLRARVVSHAELCLVSTDVILVLTDAQSSVCLEGRLCEEVTERSRYINARRHGRIDSLSNRAPQQCSGEKDTCECRLMGQG